MDTIYVADATALIAIADVADTNSIDDFWDTMTTLVEKKTLRFPRAVVEDLKVRARDEQVASWGSALGKELRQYLPEDENTSWLLRKLQLEFGFDEGLTDLDGKEPSLVPVAAYTRQLIKAGGSVRVVTEEVGEVPLRPSMQQLCDSFEWPTCRGIEFLVDLGFESVNP